MRAREAVIGVALVAAIGAVVWWRGHRTSDPPATSTVTQPAGSAGSAHAGATDPSAEPSSLVVTVTDGTAPIGDAIVRLAPEDGDLVIVHTGGDGVARATGLSPGTWAISASALGHEPKGIAKTKLEPGREQAVRLVLPVGGRELTGLVTDASTPIAGVRVDAAKLGGEIRPGEAVATTLTGPDGRYKLSVAEGQLLVAVASPDYAPQSRYIEVGAAGAVANFSLVPGGVIEGIVRDDKTKQPVPGATVSAERDRGTLALVEPARRRAIAGADGKFRLGGLRPGSYELSARAETTFSKSPTIVGLGVAEQVADVEILVGTGPVIRGHVVDEAGAPVGGLDVHARGRQDDEEATADAKGAFEISGLPPGDYRLHASSSDYLPSGEEPHVTLAARDIENVTVTVSRGLKLVGHVEPRQICEVRFELESLELSSGMLPVMLAPQTTGEDGAFSFGPVRAAKTKLAARCPSGDQGSAAIDIKSGMTDAVIDVKPGASIAGRVLDGDGKPVAGVTVMADPTDNGQNTLIVNGMITSGVQALTTATGSFELTGLRAGTYKLGSLERGKRLHNHKPAPRVTLAGADKKTGVDVVVDRPNGVIKGVVTGADGSPVADAWVTVSQDLGSMLDNAEALGSDSDGDAPNSRRSVVVESSDDANGGGATESPTALTDAHGHYELTGLAHASYSVIAEAQGGKLRGRQEAVTPDATADIRIGGVTALTGTVHGASGPAAVFSVELDGPTHDRRDFTDGTFAFARVDPGSYKVRVSSADGNAEADLKVVAGQPATIDVTLVANATVVGTLVDAAGHPVAGVAVTVVPQTGGRMEISMTGEPPQSGPDGKFHVDTHAGKSVLVVMTEPVPITRPELMLEAGKTLDVGTISLAGSGSGGSARP